MLRRAAALDPASPEPKAVCWGCGWRGSPVSPEVMALLNAGPLPVKAERRARAAEQRG